MISIKKLIKRTTCAIALSAAITGMSVYASDNEGIPRYSYNLRRQSENPYEIYKKSYDSFIENFRKSKTVEYNHYYDRYYKELNNSKGKCTRKGKIEELLNVACFFQCFNRQCDKESIREAVKLYIKLDLKGVNRIYNQAYCKYYLIDRYNIETADSMAREYERKYYMLAGEAKVDPKYAEILADLYTYYVMTLGMDIVREASWIETFMFDFEDNLRKCGDPIVSLLNCFDNFDGFKHVNKESKAKLIKELIEFKGDIRDKLVYDDVIQLAKDKKEFERSIKEKKTHHNNEMNRKIIAKSLKISELSEISSMTDKYVECLNKRPNIEAAVEMFNESLEEGKPELSLSKLIGAISRLENIESKKKRELRNDEDKDDDGEYEDSKECDEESSDFDSNTETDCLSDNCRPLFNESIESERKLKRLEEYINLIYEILCKRGECKGKLLIKRLDICRSCLRDADLLKHPEEINDKILSILNDIRISLEKYKEGFDEKLFERLNTLIKEARSCAKGDKKTTKGGYLSSGGLDLDNLGLDNLGSDSYVGSRNEMESMNYMNQANEEPARSKKDLDKDRVSIDGLDEELDNDLDLGSNNEIMADKNRDDLPDFMDGLNLSFILDEKESTENDSDDYDDLIGPEQSNFLDACSYDLETHNLIESSGNDSLYRNDLYNDDYDDSDLNYEQPSLKKIKLDDIKGYSKVILPYDVSIAKKRYIYDDDIRGYNEDERLLYDSCLRTGFSPKEAKIYVYYKGIEVKEYKIRFAIEKYREFKCLYGEIFAEIFLYYALNNEYSHEQVINKTKDAFRRGDYDFIYDKIYNTIPEYFSSDEMASKDMFGYKKANHLDKGASSYDRSGSDRHSEKKDYDRTNDRKKDSYGSPRENHRMEAGGYRRGKKDDNKIRISYKSSKENHHRLESWHRSEGKGNDRSRYSHHDSHNDHYRTKRIDDRDRSRDRKSYDSSHSSDYKRRQYDSKDRYLNNDDRKDYKYLDHKYNKD